MDDADGLNRFIDAHPFGLLISNGSNAPVATHLPFVRLEREGKTILRAHLAAQNPHTVLLEDGRECLAVFSGPHAYISPTHYTHARNVPTWNYIAVHAYGQVRVLRTEAERWAAIEDLIRQQEPGFMQQWKGLDPAYVSGLFKGIVAFELDITRMEGKQKLSQNKTAAERAGIARHLMQEDSGASQETGRAMRDQLDSEGL